MNIGSELLVVLCLTLLNGVFAGAEIALLAVRKTRLAELAREGRGAARVALELRDNPERLLATVQVGITLVSATAAAFSGAALEEPLAERLREWGLGQHSNTTALLLVVVGVSALSIVIGELVPKSLALRSSEGFSLLVSRPLWAVAYAARPVVWLLSATSNVILRPFRDQTNFSEARLSPDELQQLVEEAAQAGAMHPRAGDIASRAIDLEDLRIAAVTRPRNEVVCLPEDATKEQILNVLGESPHSRYPVVGDAGLDDVRGYVLSHELYRALLSDEFQLASLVRPVPFLPKGRRAVDGLRDLQNAKTPFAIVVDEHGGASGLVTIHDITEELVGEIFSENEAVPERIRSEGHGVYVISGLVPVHEINRELGLDLPEGPGYSTLGGLLTHEAGRLLTLGEQVSLGPDVEALVTDVSTRQIRQVRLQVTTATPESSPSSSMN